MDAHVPLSGRKRQVAKAASTPASSKRRKLDDVKAQSVKTNTTADSDVLGHDLAQPVETNGQSAARPAIKLAALKGTKWDKGDIGNARMSRQPSTPTRGSARPSPSPGKADSISKSARAVTASSTHADEPSRSPPTLRGILTPSKNRVRRLKSVTFNRGDDVYFEDLPKSPTTSKSRSSKKKRAEEEDEEEKLADDDDEIRCAICSKADSRPPNQIILCDNCDFASHQACYNVPEIPEGDWLCKSCTQEDVVQMASSKPVVIAESDDSVAAETADIANLDQHLRSLQRVLLDRCCGRRRIRMCGLEECYDKARQLVEQTVVAGEGNSMLLIGPRGCGKTTMVENMIVDLSREHRHLFHVVRLSGFIHTDDKLALKEIWRQLGKEMEVEDDLVNRTNYADTLASLLALLSHPSEITGADEGVTSQSVVFIMDEFDMFACHGRQTLLYNLLDIAQSRKAPIAVLGCTSRLDVVEMLEKRVKSRFSHRCVYLSPPRSLAAFWQVCRQGLMVDWPDVGAEAIDASLEGYDQFHRYWTRKIEELYKQPSFQNLLQYHYFTTKSVAAFFAEWVLPLTQLSAQDMRLPCPTESTCLAPPSSRLQLLSTLSDLDLAMLIAAARLDVVADTDTVNFAMAYDEYGSLVGRQRVQSATSGMLAVGGGARAWSRGLAAMAWERLISLGLLAPAGIGGVAAAGRGHGGLEGKMWRVEITVEEIPWAVQLNAVLAKWCREM
ncbi:hypothetical protein XA68_18459 [Ophiocordyceps unilateralis]|uniref:Origin recognition complex subunit 4 n=1 Tax=Ophiocordyceps unilateralis TaxID=268505 RepID=A0A2A9PJI7_OPHUN|nr:hypothetical protein XA68_18459 [Ophiocordyceps unilateralis]